MIPSQICKHTFNYDNNYLHLLFLCRGADSLDLQETRVLHQKSLPVAHREVSPPLQKSQGVAPDQTLHSSSDDDSEFKKRMRAITVEVCCFLVAFIS